MRFHWLRRQLGRKLLIYIVIIINAIIYIIVVNTSYLDHKNLSGMTSVQSYEKPVLFNVTKNQLTENGC